MNSTVYWKSNYSLSFSDKVCKVVYAALGVRVLEDDAPDVAGDVQLVEVHHLHRDAERYGPGLHTGDGLRVQLVRQHEP